ncbi:GDSL-type esterase/lipase family protein [Litchfieldia alkalitelluris]|uniref:GDSL-type esterase/lipase family protein n=1 Tax=Litchfieldia alkalitelluris TaxID=304268 RepID=UPI001472D84D|nr:GDSL-type esterase/lipase family protein [Litchfieldia alkalitelluris]
MNFKILLIFIAFVTFMVACSTQTSTYSRNVYNNVLMLKKDNIPSYFFPRDLNIVSIGDSLTEGVGDTTNRGGYTSFLEQQLLLEKGIKSVSIFNYGAQGHRTMDVLNRLSNSIPNESIHNSDAVIITIGGNDMMKVVEENFFNLSFDTFQKEQKTYQQRLKLILDKIKNVNSDTHIYVVGLYNPFLLIGDVSNEVNMVITNWNETTRTLLMEYEGTTFVEIEDIFLNNTEVLLSNDEFHPNTRGYELIAGRIAEYMEKNNN